MGDEIQRLLLKWEVIRLGYYDQLKKVEDPEIAKTILAMDFQLARCIEQLSDLADNAQSIMAHRLLTGIQNAQKEDSEPK